MVQIDCGRRFKQSQIKRAEPLKGNYSIGDLVMYRKDQDTDVPGDEWCGPARIVGFDDRQRDPWYSTSNDSTSQTTTSVGSRDDGISSTLSEHAPSRAPDNRRPRSTAWYG